VRRDDQGCRSPDAGRVKDCIAKCLVLQTPPARSPSSEHLTLEERLGDVDDGHQPPQGRTVRVIDLDRVDDTWRQIGNEGVVCPQFRTHRRRALGQRMQDDLGILRRGHRPEARRMREHEWP